MSVQYKTEQELVDYYKARNVFQFWAPENYEAMAVLSEADRLTMPQNIVFDVSGYEILHFNDKLCANHTLEFLKNYHPGMNVKLSQYHISEYLKNLKSIQGNKSKEEIINSKEIRVFVNTATFGNKYHTNDEAWKIYELYKDVYNINIVNIDFRVWDSENKE